MFDERWLKPGGVVPVDVQTTGELIREIQRLRALPQEEGRWIRVGDSLPKESERVLIYGAGFSKVCEGYLSRGPYPGCEADGYVPLFSDATEWYGEEGYPEEKQATHWMPLPSPPPQRRRMYAAIKK